MRKYLSIFMGISIIIFICIFIILIIRTSGYSDFEEVNYHSVGFTGEYSGDNGDWLPMNEILGKDIAYATVTYRGHFTENIDVYETIFLFIRNLCVTFKVNGETLYSFGQEGTYPSFSKGPGITIGEVKTTGITTEDEIEIVINNPYYSHSTSSYQLFFDQMQVGEHSAIYRFVLREIWFPILIGISIIIVGLMTIATGLIASRYHRNYRIRLLALAFFAFTGGVYTLVNSMYQYLPLIIGNPVLCNIIEILPTFLLSIAICIYFRCFIRDKKIKSISTLCCCIAICSLTLLLSLQLFGIYDIYLCKYIVFTLSEIINIVSFVLIIKDYIGHKNRETKSVIYGFICLILAILIQVIEVYREEYSLYNTWITYSILLALVTQLFALFWKVSRKDRFQIRQTRYQLLLDSSEGILFELSLNDKTFITSDKIYEKFGWKLPDRVKNFSVNVFLEVFHVHPEDDIIMKVAVLTMLKNHTFVSDVVRIMKEDGSYLWCKIKVAPFYDDNGELISLVGKIVDVDEQVRENQHLKMETRLDGLTGLLNKKTLTTEAMKYMKENSCKNSCMIFIDLDNFKRVNDILGHCFGDQAIVDAANKIKEIFSNYVYVGRFGGDEFCIFLREITRDDLEKLLLKCQRRLQEVYVKDKTIISVSSSIGAAYCLSDKVDYDILLNLADEAECAIKNSGGNGYIIREYENS